jgi:lysophospholipase
MPQYATAVRLYQATAKKRFYLVSEAGYPMFQQQKDWETRENAFAAFSMGPLTDFWRQREEAEFTGVDDIPVHFVRFHAEKNDRVIVVCPGRIESYVKYAELAYDLFHSGLTCSLSITVVRGVPGECFRSARGHVDNFNDYVDDSTASGSRRCYPARGENAISWRIQWAGRLPRYSCSATRISVMPSRFVHRCLVL